MWVINRFKEYYKPLLRIYYRNRAQCDIYLIYITYISFGYASGRQVMLRKIFTLNNYSAVITIPKELMKKVGLRRGQMVDVASKGKTIQIKDSK